LPWRPRLYEGQESILKKPNFFIIGGQRCGTTSLRRYLAEHPRIFMCENPVEPRYFATDFVAGQAGNLSLPEYLNLFREADERHEAVGDSSPTYLPSAVAVSNILAFEPAAKLVVLLRPQVEMARSLHARYVLAGIEDIEDFEEAWRLQGARREGQFIPKFCWEPAYLQYGDFCKLGEQLDRVYRKVPRDRVLAIFSQDLSTQTRDVYENVLGFLGIPSDGRQTFPVYEANRRRRSQSLNRLILRIERLKIGLGIKSIGFGVANVLDKLNEVKERRRLPNPNFERELTEYFQGDVNKLAALTGRDLAGCGKTSGARSIFM